MIAKVHKFPLRTEFLAFRRRAKRSSSVHLTAHFSPHSPSRLAVIIPKKVNKLATTRNWLRRLTFDTLWPEVRDQNLDLVVIFKPLKLAKSADTKHLLLDELNNLNLS